MAKVSDCKTLKQISEDTCVCAGMQVLVLPGQCTLSRRIKMVNSISRFIHRLCTLCRYSILRGSELVDAEAGLSVFVLSPELIDLKGFLKT